MIIKKTFHFYAAHRNQYLKGKCENLHGHRYGVTCFFLVRRGDENPNVSTLFEDFDEVDQMLQENWDHSLLIDLRDPLYAEIKKSDESWKLKELDLPSSVENICFILFSEILNLGLDLIELHIQETDSSIIQYTIDDFEKDHGPLLQYIEQACDTTQCKHEFDSKMVCLYCGVTRFLFLSNLKREEANDRTAAETAKKLSAGDEEGV